MKVVFVSPWNYKHSNFHLNGNGIEQQIIGISNSLQRLGVDVYILTRSKKAFDNLTTVNVIEIPTRFSDTVLSRFYYSINITRYIKRLSPDIIHLTDIMASYFSSKLQIPKIYTAHMVANNEMMKYNRKHNFLSYLCFSFLKEMEKNVVKRSDKIVVLNNSVSNYFIKYKYKTTLIPNGIDISGYRNDLEENTILYAGRLSSIKSIDTLILAFSRIADLYPNYRLQIIGSGQEELKLKQTAYLLSLENKIEFIPNMPSKLLRDYFAKCAVFVLPSLFETFGIVIIEAMASGKPVIASNIPGPQDIITHNKDGFLYEVGNISELSGYLEQLIKDKDLRRKIGMCAKKKAEDKYSFEKIVFEYFNIYYELLKTRTSVS